MNYLTESQKGELILYNDYIDEEKNNIIYSLLLEVKAFLEKSRKKHRYCEDSWYSCPKSENGCSNDEEGNECNCGAEQYNEELDIILKKFNVEFLYIK
jgi:hypothetical protein